MAAAYSEKRRRSSWSFRRRAAPAVRISWAPTSSTSRSKLRVEATDLREQVFELARDQREELVQGPVLELDDMVGVGFDPGQELVAVADEGEREHVAALVRVPEGGRGLGRGGRSRWDGLPGALRGRGPGGLGRRRGAERWSSLRRRPRHGSLGADGLLRSLRRHV